MTAACSAASLWPGVTCQRPSHNDDRHSADDARSTYSWSTAAIEAERRGDCPGCLQRNCTCRRLHCACGCEL